MAALFGSMDTAGLLTGATALYTGVGAVLAIVAGWGYVKFAMKRA